MTNISEEMNHLVQSECDEEYEAFEYNTPTLSPAQPSDLPMETIQTPRPIKPFDLYVEEQRCNNESKSIGALKSAYGLLKLEEKADYIYRVMQLTEVR